MLSRMSSVASRFEITLRFLLLGMKGGPLRGAPPSSLRFAARRDTPLRPPFILHLLQNKSDCGGTMPARPPNGFLHHLPRTLKKITEMGRLGLLVVGEGFELAASAGMFKFSQGFSFDLTDSFSSHLELLSDLFQGMFVSIS